MEVFLDPSVEGATPDFLIRTGHAISFRVTELGRYFNRGMIYGATDFAPIDTEQPVYIDDTGGPFTVDDVHRLVRLTGILRNPQPCGGESMCFDLMAAPDEAVDLGTFRTSSVSAVHDSCATFVGPMGWFEGRAQFDALNLTWHRLYD